MKGQDDGAYAREYFCWLHNYFGLASGGCGRLTAFGRDDFAGTENCKSHLMRIYSTPERRAPPVGSCEKFNKISGPLSLCLAWSIFLANDLVSALATVCATTAVFRSLYAAVCV